MEAETETMSTPLERMDEEVQRLADECSGDLLPLLYARMIKREGLAPCKRHDMLRRRVRAEIRLTKTKQFYRYEDFDWPSSCADILQDTQLRHPNETLNSVLEETLKVRKEYRSHPCTCWVTHR